jgi:hypothetical protein
LYTKSASFYQDRLGTNIRKALKNEWGFLAGFFLKDATGQSKYSWSPPTVDSGGAATKTLLFSDRKPFFHFGIEM